MTFPWEANANDLPPAPRRDANNVAPFLGDRTLCTLCAGAESPGFYTGCLINDGHVKDSEYDCDGRGNLTRKFSPSASLQATAPAQTLPWASTYSFPDASPRE